MSVSSVSFWQQDQNYWNKAASSSASEAQTNAVISSMFGASTTLSSGLSSIANQQALTRVNNQLTAAVQSALAQIEGGSSDSGGTGSTSSSSSSSSSSSNTSASSSSTATTAKPAIGTGTAPLTASTSLFTLGIVAKSTITVSDGTNTTTYKSTGEDTVGDLINSINKNVYGNAQVTEWLNASGQLVISGQNTTQDITVGGDAAANVGFGVGNTFFQPTKASSPASSSTAANGTSSSSSSAGSSSSTSTSSTSSSANAANGLSNSALALQTSGTAEILLAGSGIAGSLVNLLA